MLSDKSAGAVSDDHNNVVWLDILYVHDAGADIHTIIKGKRSVFHMVLLQSWGSRKTGVK